MTGTDTLIPAGNFRYSAASGNTRIRGMFTLSEPSTSHRMTEDFLDQAEVLASLTGQPWDPYNVEVAFSATK